MIRFNNISIPGKIYGLVGFLLLFVVAVSGALIWTVKDTNQRYSNLLRHDAASLVEVMRIRGDLQNFGRQMNIVLLLEHPPEGVDALEQSIATLSAGIEASAKATAERSSPAQASMFTDIATALAQMKQTAAATIAIKRAARPGQDAEARALWDSALGRGVVVKSYDRIAEAAETRVRQMRALSASYDEQVTGTVTLSYIAIGVALVGAVSLAFAVATVGIARPLARMTGSMKQLAVGDLTAEIPGVGRGDEVGAMAGAVQVFKDNALRTRELERQQDEARDRQEADRSQAEAERAAEAQAVSLVVGSIGTGLERLAAGDLTFRVADELPPAYERLRSNLNTAMEQLQSVVRGIVVNTAGLRSGTSEISQAADDLSRRTEQQAAGLEETAAALDEITASVRKTAEGAKHASTVVARTNTVAKDSGEVVGQAVAAMGKIEKSSKEISQIIGVIDEIAFQTNLLALNAGVEAARAGDAGRGFAVVASEVRALAQRSAEAAREIKALISASTEQVGAGAKLVGETGQALARIMAEVGEISTVVAEIAASAQEQSTGLQEVNTTVNQFDQVTQQNAAMVEQSTAATHALVQETEELVRLTSRFQLGDDGGPSVARPTNAPRQAGSATKSTRPSKPATVTSMKVVSQRGQSAVRKPAATASEHPAEEGWDEF